MKINLNSKRNRPAVAYLSQDKFILSVFFKGQVQLIQYDVTETATFESIVETKSLEIKQGTELLMILSNQLVLYSQLKLPKNLSDQEVSELIDLQLSQRQQDSLIDTYYDYYPLQTLEDSVIFGLFEARKDKLDTVIESLKNLGFNVSLILPHALVIVNQLLNDDSLSDQQYQLVCRLGQQVLIAHIANRNLTELRLIELDENQFDALIYAELQIQLNSLDCKTVICLGLDVQQLKQHLLESDFKVIDYGLLSSRIDMTSLTINWMREQHGLYKSIALA